MERRDRVILATFATAALGLLAYGAYSESQTEKARGSSPAQSLQASSPAPSLAAAPASASAAPKAPRERVTATELLNQTCSPAEEAACDCRLRATLSAFDRRAPEAALDIVQTSAEDCRKGALMGLEAEALARNGKSEQALAEAARILAVDPKNPYAAYARGLSYQKTGQATEAFSAAREAVKHGRGATAHVLVGLLEYRDKDFDEAEKAFEKALEVDPNSAEALFNLAVLNQRRNDYHKTREGYLRTLRVDPTHADALYNLAILTRGIGATGEARHYTDKLSRVVGDDDPRVVRLRETLG
ncbi:MAG TPA: tetratricopeptide repeat protein, partial [Polyangiaceae bacterium]|nr:tetratricopeptide repeat protein [Polyangiaceae bacterium]